MEYKDYYVVMGVARNATQDEIKQSYRRLARKYHPDVSKETNAEEKFKNLQEAYEVLKDPEKRAAYDQLGSNWKAGQEFKPPPGWESQSRFYTKEDMGNFTEGDLGGFSDFFSQLFGRGARMDREGFASFKQRGRDQHAKIMITLQEAYTGTAKTFQMQIPEIDASGHMHSVLRTIKVNIPAGTTKGQQLRLTGQGSQGIGGGPAGDLYLEIDIAHDVLFSLQGRDVFLTLPLTPWEAALGANIKVPTLGGIVGLKINAGARSGQKLRLKGRGMPGKPAAGDQYVMMQIETPQAHNEKEREFYQKMAETMPFNPRKLWASGHERE